MCRIIEGDKLFLHLGIASVGDISKSVIEVSNQDRIKEVFPVEVSQGYQEIPVRKDVINYEYRRLVLEDLGFKNSTTI